MFPSGSSSTSNPPEQCTNIVINNDRTPEDQDDYFNLLASSSDPSVFFTPGRKNVSVLIQDDDSKYMCNRKQKKLSKKLVSDGMSYSNYRKSEETRGNAITHPHFHPIHKM